MTFDENSETIVTLKQMIAKHNGKKIMMETAPMTTVAIEDRRRLEKNNNTAKSVISIVEPTTLTELTADAPEQNDNNDNNEIQDEKNKPSLAIFIQSTIESLKEKRNELTEEIKREKESKNDISLLSSDLKIIKNKLKDLVILSNLYSMRESADTTAFFTQWESKKDIAQFCNFNLSYAFNIITIADDMNYSEEYNKMETILKNIQELINLIDNARIYENMREDIIPPLDL